MQAKCSKAMQSFREQLPAYKMKADFLKAVADNQVYFSIWIKYKKKDLVRLIISY